MVTVDRTYLSPPNRVGGTGETLRAKMFGWVL
jgi:hypothetical protein